MPCIENSPLKPRFLSQSTWRTMIMFPQSSTILKKNGFTNIKQQFGKSEQYKTNSHRMTFVNIVGTSNVRGNSRTTLMTFPIARAWVEHKTTANYLLVNFGVCAIPFVQMWVIAAVTAKRTTTTTVLPSVFTTDNKKALRNAITNEGR
ncbi:hypothetical protein PHYBLDRAFT_160858 [Phycomyces blakesleeanus NRRL 1555(-)]|uniref:Uncharacterized protein n=1 Tax=Phycomyces blakesleeanus (strain ATCC 8743b / DSM 1359 / FGSC 10004 / NBRC 33097 / NRRL 1555) TaxID=763407 RepID=A0A167J6A6_PHYB8|nr:hypothetical protein PHYBLDRAFT_160858 [Phycomyces blakesleeanus NRRL 1555(-)]OAD65249.1 hypothetical protein PHYBLDRAFT_160858 [Phycomyces blakesleeanus NRRL 1555(-)]|eukprot:XP_018283289.1 hypothetical protein PHYBLDRAFT_160858 [Phycomyces blakesleeanus NRRL 1555(-)]